MADKTNTVHPRADRLRGVVAEVRSHAGREGIISTAKGQRAGAGRAAIKFPNAAGALRQHVAQVQKETTQRPKVRLRLPPKTVTQSVPENGALAQRPRSLALTEITTPADLGRMVRAARDRQRLSQSALASLAGTGRRFIVELEAGKPTAALGLSLAVCRALGIALATEGPSDE